MDMLQNIAGLMENGKPVRILFSRGSGTNTELLFCELIQKARYGESFIISRQGCSVCEYVFGKTEKSPAEYYFKSNRYADQEAALSAASSLKRLDKKWNSIEIAPYSGEIFDVLIFFLKPEKAMRIVQAYAYRNGDPSRILTGGIASICSDCTAIPMKGYMGISFGCKGSRKHSKYGDDEVIAGIPFALAKDIEEALGKIPPTFS